MTNPKQSFRINEKWGLNSKSLKKKQMPMFEYWVMQYLDQINLQLTESLLEEVDESDFEDFYLVWSGQMDITKKSFYYLIYNEQVIIEHSLKDNHIHSIVRISF